MNLLVTRVFRIYQTLMMRLVRYWFNPTTREGEYGRSPEPSSAQRAASEPRIASNEHCIRQIGPSRFHDTQTQDRAQYS